MRADWLHGADWRALGELRPVWFDGPDGLDWLIGIKRLLRFERPDGDYRLYGAHGPDWFDWPDREHGSVGIYRGNGIVEHYAAPA